MTDTIQSPPCETCKSTTHTTKGHIDGGSPAPATANGQIDGGAPPATANGQIDGGAPPKG
jgi:hypothetical protein